MGNSLCCTQNGSLEDANNDVTTIEIQKRRFADTTSKSTFTSNPLHQQAFHS